MVNNEDVKLTPESARVTAEYLIKAAKAAVGEGVRVPADKEFVFGPVFSWWRLVCRTSELVLSAVDSGFGAEVGPLVRNVLNHAYALNWLVDNGDPAMYALVRSGRENQRKMVEKVEKTNWPGAVELRAVYDRVKELPEPEWTQAEERRIVMLVHELGNFHDQLDRYGAVEVYPAYSHLSSLSHTSIETASLYLSHAEDGSRAELMLTSWLSPDTYVIQVTLSLLQTASVISPLIGGDPMRDAIEKATGDLGLEGIQLLPERTV
ncbi:DUF5677 domain-containing protein [Streptomyces cinereoruber]|uniref:DUF5677 domain-containing protein n=1 Tax=Streptomyces cinereoruber TaxID=67260 RepID=UPI00363CCC36